AERSTDADIAAPIASGRQTTAGFAVELELASEKRHAGMLVAEIAQGRAARTAPPQQVAPIAERRDAAPFEAQIGGDGLTKPTGLEARFDDRAAKHVAQVLRVRHARHGNPAEHAREDHPQLHGLTITRLPA